MERVGKIAVSLILLLVALGAWFYVEKFGKPTGVRQNTYQQNQTLYNKSLNETKTAFTFEKLALESMKQGNVTVENKTIKVEDFDIDKIYDYLRLSYVSRGKIMVRMNRSAFCNSTLNPRDLQEAFKYFVSYKYFCREIPKSICNKTYTPKTYEEYYMIDVIRVACNKTPIYPSLKEVPDDEKEKLYYVYFARVLNVTVDIENITKSVESEFIKECIRSPQYECFPELAIVFRHNESNPLLNFR